MTTKKQTVTVKRVGENGDCVGCNITVYDPKTNRHRCIRCGSDCNHQEKEQ